MKSKFLIDLDGTILNGSEIINESPLFFERIRETGSDFLIMTNSVSSPEMIRSRLSDSGINVPLRSIINPITAINSHLLRKSIQRAYVVGSEAEIAQIKISHDETDPEIIILLDFEKNNYSFSELQKIFSLIQKGIPAVAASGSTFYYKNGEKYLDTGAFVRLFEEVCSSKIEVFGKPSRSYYREAFYLLGCLPENVLVIGDDWSTDGLGAVRAGCRALLVKTGKYREGDEEKITGLSTINSLMDTLVL